jgi:hypothetical protein
VCRRITMKDEYATAVVPLQALDREADQLERELSDLVNAAFGLTLADVALMWQTAPPRMPFAASGPRTRRKGPTCDRNHPLRLVRHQIRRGDDEPARPGSPC